MKRKTFAFKTTCFLVLTYTAINISAQSLYDQSLRNWDEGPVRWNELQIRHTPDDTKYVSNLYCSIEQDIKKEIIGNFKIPVLTTTTKMNKLSSWYDPDKCTDWTLRYEQTRFDMLEVLRRRMQNSFNKNCMEKNLDAYYEHLISSTMTAFDMESNYGADTLVILKYEEQYKSELDTMTMESVQIPVFQTSNWGVSLCIGIGIEKFGSPISKGVTSATGIQWGIGMIYKKMTFGFNCLIAGAGKLQCDNFYHDSEYDYTWTEGRNVRTCYFSADAGYRMLDKSYLSLVPFIGIGASFLYQDSDTPQKNNNNSFEPSGISGFRTQAGLALDWKYRRKINTYLYGAEYTESKIRFAISGARTNYKGMGPTYSLNASVTMVFEGWNLK